MIINGPITFNLLHNYCLNKYATEFVARSRYKVHTHFGKSNLLTFTDFFQRKYNIFPDQDEEIDMIFPDFSRRKVSFEESALSSTVHSERHIYPCDNG